MKCKEIVKKHSTACPYDIRGMQCDCEQQEECGTEMVKKGSISDHTISSQIETIYQCPSCKNIEIN